MDRPEHGRTRPAAGVAAALATVLGVGRFPIASGTAGSLVALPVCWVLSATGGAAALGAAAAVVTVLGVWASDRVVRATGDRDPSEVVVDEVAGQMTALIALPATWQVLAAAFLLFRGFDIIKPPPIRTLERLPGGWGVMADDLAAGICANLLLQVAVRHLPRVLGLT